MREPKKTLNENDKPAWMIKEVDKKRWIILDTKKAKEMHIELAKIDDSHALLCIDCFYVPKGMSMDEFMDYIQNAGIVVNDTEGKYSNEQENE